MIMRKFTITSVCGFVVIAILILFASCIPGNPDRADCPLKKGIVERIVADSGTGDVTFYLESGNGSFYINRGIQQKLPVSDWQKNLPGNEITIAHYGRFPHICEIGFGDSVLYSEFE